jgi:hypothetical protein
MMWIDIGVTVLLTLRIVLFRQHFRSFWIRIMRRGYRREKAEQQECLFVGAGEANEHSPRKP